MFGGFVSCSDKDDYEKYHKVSSLARKPKYNSDACWPTLPPSRKASGRDRVRSRRGEVVSNGMERIAINYGRVNKSLNSALLLQKYDDCYNGANNSSNNNIKMKTIIWGSSLGEWNCVGGDFGPSVVQIESEDIVDVARDRTFSVYDSDNWIGSALLMADWRDGDLGRWPNWILKRQLLGSWYLCDKRCGSRWRRS